MYCINCGVELADSEKNCPLCGTVVFHPELSRPDGDPTFPPQKKAKPEEVERAGALFILTVLFALPAVIMLLVDWQVNRRIVWAGYASLALVLLYVLAVLPLWFKKANPVIFVPSDFAAVALYVLYICVKSGGYWYLGFALPVIAGAAVIVCATLALLRYLRRGWLFIFGGAFILTGAYMVQVEYLLNRVFMLSDSFIWAFYPLAACVIVGGLLILVGMCRPIRESLYKKFFI